LYILCKYIFYIKMAYCPPQLKKVASYDAGSSVSSTSSPYASSSVFGRTNKTNPSTPSFSNNSGFENNGGSGGGAGGSGGAFPFSKSRTNTYESSISTSSGGGGAGAGSGGDSPFGKKRQSSYESTYSSYSASSTSNSANRAKAEAILKTGGYIPAALKDTIDEIKKEKKEKEVYNLESDEQYPTLGGGSSNASSNNLSQQMSGLRISASSKSISSGNSCSSTPTAMAAGVAATPKSVAVECTTPGGGKWTQLAKAWSTDDFKKKEIDEQKRVRDQKKRDMLNFERSRLIGSSGGIKSLSASRQQSYENFSNNYYGSSHNLSNRNYDEDDSDDENNNNNNNNNDACDNLLDDDYDDDYICREELEEDCDSSDDSDDSRYNRF
jgi:hypothetical protein